MIKLGSLDSFYLFNAVTRIVEVTGVASIIFLLGSAPFWVLELRANTESGKCREMAIGVC